jgi:hypothetical protein
MASTAHDSQRDNWPRQNCLGRIAFCWHRLCGTCEGTDVQKLKSPLLATRNLILIKHLGVVGFEVTGDITNASGWSFRGGLKPNM